MASSQEIKHKIVNRRKTLKSYQALMNSRLIRFRGSHHLLTIDRFKHISRTEQQQWIRERNERKDALKRIAVEVEQLIREVEALKAEYITVLGREIVDQAKTDLKH